MSFVVPEDAQDGDTIHMVITVKDDGAHNMTHYQRVIVKVQEDRKSTNFSLNYQKKKMQMQSKLVHILDGPTHTHSRLLQKHPIKMDRPLQIKQ